jgi:hypothetical protein
MESLLLFRRAFSSPTMCRFIPALSVTCFSRPVFACHLFFAREISILSPEVLGTDRKFANPKTQGKLPAPSPISGTALASNRSVA